MKKGLLMLLIAGSIFLTGNSQMFSSESVVCAAEQDTETGTIFTEVYVNPVYEDVFPDDDPFYTPSNGISLFSEPEYETKDENIVNQIRQGMKNRQNTIKLYYASEIAYDSSWVNKWVELALEETEDPHEGDYLRWNYGRYQINGEYTQYDGIYYYNFEMNVQYYTTAKQEKELDTAIEEQIIGLGLNDPDISDYEKVRKVYDFICTNISYDYENLNDDSYFLKFTAYAALINKKAVCQGYSALMYRMLEDVGVDTRMIYGIGNGGAHGWNMTNMGVKYYFLDATWDAGQSEYRYFLKGKNNFSDHEIDSEMDSTLDVYPLSGNDYSVTKIKLDQFNLELSPKQSVKLKLTILPDGTGAGETILWSSSDNNKVSIDQKGNVTAIAPGTAVITAKAAGRIATCDVTVTEESELPSGQWIQNSKGWWYRNPDGSYPSNGWSKIEEKWYYFDAQGYRVTGWKKISEKWYYLDPKTGIMQTGWIKVGGKIYYMSSSGVMKTGWETINDEWYYFNSSGARENGWINIGNKWYYMDPETGIMQTGWIKVGGKSYYMSSSGTMQTGWMSIENKWYYLNSSGTRASGWVKVGNKWYYMDPETGIMYADQWLSDTYYLSSSGVMAIGWEQIDNIWYYFNDNGNKVRNSWVGNYYLKADGSMAVNEWVDGTRYFVDENGVWVPNKVK